MVWEIRVRIFLVSSNDIRSPPLRTFSTSCSVDESLKMRILRRPLAASTHLPITYFIFLVALNRATNGGHFVISMRHIVTLKSDENLVIGINILYSLIFKNGRYWPLFYYFFEWRSHTKKSWSLWGVNMSVSADILLFLL